MVVINADQTISLINKKGCEVLGFPTEEIVGKNWFDTFLPERVRERVRAVFLRLLAGETEVVGHVENLVLTARGAERVIAWHNTVLRDERGKICATLSSGKTSQSSGWRSESLRESEERFSKAFHCAPIPTSISRISDGLVLDVNSSLLELLGRQRDEIVGRTTVEMRTWQGVDERRKALEVLADTGRISDFEMQVRSRTAGRRDVLASAVRIELDGEPCMLSMVRDVTDRKHAREELEASEERFRTLAASAPIGIMLIDNVEGLVYSNTRCRDIFRVPWEKAAGFGWVESLHPDDRRAFLAHRSRTMAEGQEFIREFRIVTPEGDTRWLTVHTTPVLSQDGASNTRVGTVQDVTERKRAMEALRESENRLRQVLELSSDLIYRLDLESRTYDYVSPSVLRLSGFTEKEFAALGIHGIRHRVHPDDWPEFKRKLRRGA